MARNSKYTYDQLVGIYSKYARLKGWSTRPNVVRDNIDSWMSKSLGPVGLAISFHETGIDDLGDRGIDAGARSKHSLFQPIVFELAGSNYQNEDGGSRLEVALSCMPFEVLDMKQEPHNIHDPQAIAILTRKAGLRLGYVPRSMTSSIIEYARDGYRFVPAVIYIGESSRLRMSISSSGFSSDSCVIKIVLYTFKLELGLGEIDRLAAKWQADYRAGVGDIDWSNLFRRRNEPDPDSADPLVCLGLEARFTEEQLKVAYKECAKRYHPDLHSHQNQVEIRKMESRMANINTAYEALRLRVAL